MCNAEATTREHVPPRSFFPKTRRKSPVTVPSCYDHNHDQSLDVEYVGNVIASLYGGNEQAEQMIGTAERSFDRSPAFFYQTFGLFEEVSIDGQTTVAFPIDLERLKSVIRTIASAIYFKDQGRKYPASWTVFATSLKSYKNLEGEPDGWERLRTLLDNAQFDTMHVPQPDIFTYSVCEMPDVLIYRLVFYGGFTVHVWEPVSSKLGAVYRGAADLHFAAAADPEDVMPPNSQPSLWLKRR
jgi:hypothetical protein